MKRPAYQWYPGDFRRDTALQSCSWEARAFWRDLLDIMHDGEPYGHLAVNGRGIPIERVAAMIGLPLPRCRKYLGELEAAGVCSRTDEGVLFSRRMVKDEHIRAVRAEAGKQGGNPVLLLKQPDKPAPSKLINQKPTPAVAVAVASAKTLPDDPDGRVARQVDDALPDAGHKSALQALLRASPSPYAFLCTVNAVLSGMHRLSPHPTQEQVGSALWDMHVNGKPPEVAVLHAYCTRAARPKPPPRDMESGEDVDEYEKQARKFDQQEKGKLHAI